MGTGAADDYYALLGVDADADIATLRRAFRQLALQWHPDRAGTDTTVIFQRISAAYEVLADPVTRADYDRVSGVTGRRFQARAATAEAAAEAPPRRRAPGVLLSRMSRSLTILLAMGSARRDDDGVIELLLEEWEATQGGMITISMRVLVRCPACAGTGTCDRCGSQGAVEATYSAWLAVPPEVAEGTVLNPSVRLPGMIEPVSFRVCIAA